jgi:hypothetical protein
MNDSRAPDLPAPELDPQQDLVGGVFDVPDSLWKIAAGPLPGLVVPGARAVALGYVSGAREVLAQAGAWAGSQLYSLWMRAFLLAALARRAGDEPFLDERMETAGGSGEFNLPLASYLQATACHPQCRDREARFRRAAEILRRDAGPRSPENLLHGLASLMDLAAAPAEGWSEEKRLLGSSSARPPRWVCTGITERRSMHCLTRGRTPLPSGNCWTACPISDAGRQSFTSSNDSASSHDRPTWR